MSLWQQELYDLGGRNMAILGLPPIGCLPAQITLHGSNNSQDCIKEYNDVALNFNSLLQVTLNDMKKSMHGARVLYVDIFSYLYNVFQNPKAYGIVPLSSHSSTQLTRWKPPHTVIDNCVKIAVLLLLSNLLRRKYAWSGKYRLHIYETGLLRNWWPGSVTFVQQSGEDLCGPCPAHLLGQLPSHLAFLQPISWSDVCICKTHHSSSTPAIEIS